MKSQYARNKFYVGSHHALKNRWGHPTLARALNHASKILQEDTSRNSHVDGDEVFVVQIVRVVRRKRVPVQVEVVK